MENQQQKREFAQKSPANSQNPRDSGPIKNNAAINDGPGSSSVTNNLGNADDQFLVDDDAYFDSFPSGYRFKPYDEELIVYYLQPKILNEPLQRNRIKEVELYKYNPETLAENYLSYGEKEWYFFTPRDRKYRNGERPNRAAGDGYWKATGADKQINVNGAIVGFRKALVFYHGKPPRGNKTDWIMHEYKVNNPPKQKRVGNDMRLDDWVLCRIYKKDDKSIKAPLRLRDNPLQVNPSENNGVIVTTEHQNHYQDSTMLPKETSMPNLFDMSATYNHGSHQMGLSNAYGSLASYQDSQNRFPSVLHDPLLEQNSLFHQHMVPDYGNYPTSMVEPLSSKHSWSGTESYMKDERFGGYHPEELSSASTLKGSSNLSSQPDFGIDQLIINVENIYPNNFMNYDDSLFDADKFPLID